MVRHAHLAVIPHNAPMSLERQHACRVLSRNAYPVLVQSRSRLQRAQAVAERCSNNLRSS